MPLQSVELLLDPASDRQVRDLWDALSQQGIRSQADHHGATNAPHVTLAEVAAVPDEGEQALVPIAARLPLRLGLAAPVLLGERRPALVLPVAPDEALDALHQQVRSAVGATAAGEELPWRPHVTLARRLPAAVAPTVLALAASLPVPTAVVATVLRRWDPDRRAAWVVGGPPGRPSGAPPG